MLRVFASFLIALSLAAAPMQALASQAAMHSAMVAAALDDAPAAGHHAVPKPECSGGDCQTSLEKCAIACISLPAALPGAGDVSRIVVPSSHWPPGRAALATGQGPALPEQPPKPHLL